MLLDKIKLKLLYYTVAKTAKFSLKLPYKITLFRSDVGWKKSMPVMKFKTNTPLLYT